MQVIFSKALTLEHYTKVLEGLNLDGDLKFMTLHQLATHPDLGKVAQLDGEAQLLMTIVPLDGPGVEAGLEYGPLGLGVDDVDLGDELLALLVGAHHHHLQGVVGYSLKHP